MAKPRPPIDWSAVEDAMRRSTEGRSKEGDFEMCRDARDREPEEYGRRNRVVREAVQDAERNRWR
jgi:hypothetical protein